MPTERAECVQRTREGRWKLVFAKTWAGTRAWSRAWGPYAIVSLLLIAPCCWQRRIQSADLPSHLYNAWLALEVQQGKVQGLELVPQWTNVLFDWTLRRLLSISDPRTAEHLAAAVAVLIFFWGAFAFTRAFARRPPWHLVPCFAMLAYGWVFHMGFFNFYISLGLCFWFLALFLRKRKPAPLMLILLLLAVLAHALPVVWTISLTAYIWAARRTRPRHRVFLAAGGVGVIVALKLLLAWRYEFFWSAAQTRSMTGADQLWILGPKYSLFGLALLIFWSLLFVRLVEQKGVERTVLGIPLQLVALNVAGVVLIPTAIFLPGYRTALEFIAERMSLAVAVLVCALLASARPVRFQIPAIGVTALCFFAALHGDTQRLNRVEEQLDSITSELPPGVRVISDLALSGSRVPLLAHTVDRACIGRCFSYANYEPATGQFTLRALPGNRVVLTEPGDIAAVVRGTYLVRKGDDPLYQISGDASGPLLVRLLKPGDTNGADSSAQAALSPGR